MEYIHIVRIAGKIINSSLLHFGNTRMCGKVTGGVRISDEFTFRQLDFVRKMKFLPIWLLSNNEQDRHREFDSLFHKIMGSTGGVGYNKLTVWVQLVCYHPLPQLRFGRYK